MSVGATNTLDGDCFGFPSVAANVKREPPPRTDNYQEPREDFNSCALIVEGKKLFVVRELLALASPFFKALFSTNFKEGHQDEIELPGKKFQSIVCLLDYLYPTSKFQMTDAKAVALLPLADEYQLSVLTVDCVNMLEKVEPRLELVTLAAKYNLKDFLKSSMNRCKQKVYHKFLNSQRKLPENKDLDIDLFIEIMSGKLEFLRINTNYYNHPQNIY